MEHKIEFVRSPGSLCSSEVKTDWEFAGPVSIQLSGAEKLLVCL